MKRTIIYCFLVAVLMGTARITNAQTEKGKFLIGGQSKLEYSTYKSGGENQYTSGNNGKTRNLDITPQIGRFIANNFAVGLEVPYSHSKEIDGDDSYATSSLLVMAFMRYYFGKTKIKPYLHGAIGPGWGKTKLESSQLNNDPNFTINSKISKNLMAYELGGGLGVFVNEHVSLDFSLGYGHITSKYTDFSNMDRKDIVKGIDANIGIVVCL